MAINWSQAMMAGSRYAPVLWRVTRAIWTTQPTKAMDWSAVRKLISSLRVNRKEVQMSRKESTLRRKCMGVWRVELAGIRSVTPRGRISPQRSAGR